MTHDAILAGEAVEVAAHLSALGEVYAALDRLEASATARHSDATDAAALMAWRTAVVEIATNIMRHAYPPDGTAGPLRVQLQLYMDRVEAHLSDDGIEFTLPDTLTPPPIDDLLGLPEGGIGLFLARQSVDMLTHERTPQGANHWRLVKYLMHTT